MKIYILLGILVFLSINSFSQNKRKDKEDELWIKINKKLISKEKYFFKLQTEAGKIPNRLSSAWHKKTSKISNPKTNGLKIRFRKQNLKVTKNGNIYRKMVLENNTNDTLSIQRIDATIGGLQEYFLIEGKWIKNRQNEASPCRNSYYTQHLKPFNQIDFELSNGGLINGEIEINYKIELTVGNKKIQSNTIKVKLYKNQYERLKSKKRI